MTSLTQQTIRAIATGFAGLAGAAIVVLMLVMALLADFIAPYDPAVNAFDRMAIAPNAENWLGTDQSGQIGRAHVGTPVTP